MLPRIINGAAAKSSGQLRLNNIDQTHLVLVSGKPVLQKNYIAKLNHNVPLFGLWFFLASCIESYLPAVNISNLPISLAWALT